MAAGEVTPRRPSIFSAAIWQQFFRNHIGTRRVKRLQLGLGPAAKGSHDMNLPRVVDTKIPDHWTDRSQSLRSALDCFAPLAITIRAKPGIFEQRPKQVVR